MNFDHRKGIKLSKEEKELNNENIFQIIGVVEKVHHTYIYMHSTFRYSQKVEENGDGNL